MSYTLQRIVALAGREVNQANPIVDTRLPDGSRVNVAHCLKKNNPEISIVAS
jgi:Flp pilus assembly CpaF family ATPase